MEVKTKIMYEEGYLPSKRHRKLRYRFVEDEITVNVNEATKEEAPVAFRVKSSTRNEEYRWWGNRLWLPVLWSSRVSGKTGLYPLEEFLKSLNYYTSGGRSTSDHITKEEAIERKLEYIDRFLVVDGVVYEVAGEPRYVIMTMGLGHNHGGTHLAVTDFYNPNIGKSRYFNALEREKAIEEAKRIALGRGDTDSVKDIDKYCNIEVLIPEAVRCNPQVEHGDGDPFLNKLEETISGASSTGEAAVLAVATLMSEINK